MHNVAFSCTWDCSIPEKETFSAKRQLQGKKQWVWEPNKFLFSFWRFVLIKEETSKLAMRWKNHVLVHLFVLYLCVSVQFFKIYILV